ncbi:MAG: hypothetical protein ACPKPY_08380 [Nitrososphaeraceae archaeon]
MNNYVDKNKMIIFTVLPVILSGLMLISTQTQAFGHSSQVVTTDIEIGDPTTPVLQDKKIRIVLGHSNEPAYGKLPGIHDGKHNVEFILSDGDTRAPLTGAELTVDKYYFKNIESFNAATTLDEADYTEKDVRLGGVFGEPGLYWTRQVIDPGIYVYTVKGTIDFYQVGKYELPEEGITKACRILEDGNDLTTKFDSKNWVGGFGCPIPITDIYFPPQSERHYSDEYGYNGDEYKYQDEYN